MTDEDRFSILFVLAAGALNLFGWFISPQVEDRALVFLMYAALHAAMALCCETRRGLLFWSSCGALSLVAAGVSFAR